MGFDYNDLGFLPGMTTGRELGGPNPAGRSLGRRLPASVSDIVATRRMLRPGRISSGAPRPRGSARSGTSIRTKPPMFSSIRPASNTADPEIRNRQRFPMLLMAAMLSQHRV